MKVQLYQDLLTINWNLLFSLITVVVLVLILKKFFFEKVHSFMEARQQQVVNTLQEAQATREEAQQKLEVKRHPRCGNRRAGKSSGIS